MNSNAAAENLLVIRTLMERAALYRRALAPIMLLAGGLGVAGSVAASLLHIDALPAFILFWFAVAAVACAGSFLIARRQSMKDKEPLWSPPTRRVSQALAPPLVIGFLLGALAFMTASSDEGAGVILPLAWMLCFGCALHAAGFFMPRGIGFLGWLFVVGACGVFGLCLWANRVHEPDPAAAHLIMGVFFGAVHLVYGIGLALTEKRKATA